MEGVKFPVHVFPILPFLGPGAEAVLIDVSEGGLAFRLNRMDGAEMMSVDRELMIHFRMPGHPLSACLGAVRHNRKLEGGDHLVGIRFLKTPVALSGRLKKMAIGLAKMDRVPSALAGLEIALEAVI